MSRDENKGVFDEMPVEPCPLVHDDELNERSGPVDVIPVSYEDVADAWQRVQGVQGVDLDQLLAAVRAGQRLRNPRFPC